MTIFRFETFEFDSRARELKKNGRRVHVGDQPLRLLNLLLERPGELVTREELQSALWSDGTSVDYETAINKAVSQLRTALGDSPASPRFLETLAKRGYRFVARAERSAEPPRARPRVRSVAVLPFENLTGDPSQQFLADAFSDALITALGSANGLRVVSRTSARASQTMNRPLSDIARLLRAEVCVEGSVSHAGERARIAVRLIDAAEEHVLWQGRYDQPRETLIGFADTLARALSAELGTSMNAAANADPDSAGQTGAATAALEQAVQLAGDVAMWQANLCFARGRGGDLAGARKTLANLQERERGGEYISPFDLAVCCAGIADTDGTLDYLERAYAERDIRVMTVRDPEFDEVSSTPRYHALLARLRLPEIPKPRSPTPPWSFRRLAASWRGRPLPAQSGLDLEVIGVFCTDHEGCDTAGADAASPQSSKGKVDVNVARASSLGQTPA